MHRNKVSIPVTRPGYKEAVGYILKWSMKIVLTIQFRMKSDRKIVRRVRIRIGRKLTVLSIIMLSSVSRMLECTGTARKIARKILRH
jgi:hypothetical protein